MADFDWSWVWVGGGGGCGMGVQSKINSVELSWGFVEVDLGLWQLYGQEYLYLHSESDRNNCNNVTTVVEEMNKEQLDTGESITI